MVVECKIIVSDPMDGQFVPGSEVCGIIQYGFDENIHLERIIVSLKGVGRLTLTKSEGVGNQLKKHHFYNREDYVDIDHTVKDEEKGLSACSGQRYETQFSFWLPENIPPSLSCIKSRGRYKITCNIMYYVRVKFEIPNCLKYNKTFHTITVVSGIIPPTEPMIHHERKKLFQLFERKDSYVDITASLKSSTLCPGGKIELDCEVKNISSITILSIEAKLVEVCIFYAKTLNGVKFLDVVKDTDSKIGKIRGGQSRHMSLELMLPAELLYTKYSKMVSRDYSVVITVELPFPHRNLVFEVPIKTAPEFAEVDNAAIENQTLEIDGVTYDAPPPYHQLMP